MSIHINKIKKVGFLYYTLNTHKIFDELIDEIDQLQNRYDELFDENST